MGQRASQDRSRNQAKGLRDFRGNRAHLELLLDAIDRGDAKGWNRWRKQNPRIRPDLRGFDLEEFRPHARLQDINLAAARLSRARLYGLQAWGLRLSGADLSSASLERSDLSYSDLRGANLRSARLVQANLTYANAREADLRDANLSHATMNHANLESADLRGARVAGLNAWDLQFNEKTRQQGLVLEDVGDFLEDLVDESDAGKSSVPVVGRVDHIEAVYLLHLIRDKAKFRTVIDALTSNVVLLLGNFGVRKKSVLSAMALRLYRLGYLPVTFDFEAPADRDLIETVFLLANLSCFVIADISQPKSTPLETMLVAPNLGVPLSTIIQEGEPPFSMFRSLQAKYDWVLPTIAYRDKAHLVRRLKPDIIEPCEAVRARLRKRRAM